MLPNREFHPVAGLFPLLRAEALQALAADIQSNGLLEPILVDAQGRILDGRNRYLACLQAGVEPRFVDWQGEGSPVEMALSRNLHRRHLDESQRALVAARLARLLETETVKRKSSRYREDPANLQGPPEGESRVTAAKRINVSPRLVSYAIKVLDQGSAELLAAVESGEVAVSTAAVLAALPAEDQAQVLAGGPQVAAAAARERRSRKNKATAPLPCPGSFGIFPGQAAGGQDNNAAQHGIVLLWVAAGALADAVDALQARGLRYQA